MRLTQIATILLLALGGLILPVGEVHAGGGGVGTGSGICAGFSSGQELVMLDNCFNGVAHFSPSGSTLLVKNDGLLPHTLTAVDGSFDTGILQPGESIEIQVGEDGISRVFCTLHGSAHGAGMAGVLVVGDAPPGSISAASSTSDSTPNRPTSDPQEGSVGNAQEELGEVRGAARITILTVITVGIATGALVVAMNRKSAAPLLGQQTHDDGAMT